MKVAVNFRIFIKGNEGLMAQYRGKFSELMREVSGASSKLSEFDYDDLPDLRRAVNNVPLQEIPEISEVVEPPRLKKLLNVGPVFDVSPTDLKAHILMCLGVRSYHLKQRV